VDDALSRRTSLLKTMHVEVVNLNCTKYLYEGDADFSIKWKACREPWSIDQTRYLDYHIQEGFLFKNQQLCIPQSSIRLNLIKELHSGGLGGHFGLDKTITLVKEIYFWPSLGKDVRRFVEGYRICQLAKGKSQNTRLYTPFPVPTKPWEDIIMDFVLGLPMMHQKHDSTMVVVDFFLKMAHYVACNKTSDASEVDSLFLKEVVRLHGLPWSITSDQDTRFLGYFWRTIWKRLGSNLLYSSDYHLQMNK